MTKCLQDWTGSEQIDEQHCVPCIREEGKENSEQKKKEAAERRPNVSDSVHRSLLPLLSTNTVISFGGHVIPVIHQVELLTPFPVLRRVSPVVIVLVHLVAKRRVRPTTD